MLRGSGFFPKPAKEDILLLSFILIIFSSSKKIFWLILFPFTLLYAIYTPIGLNFGGPSYQHIASLIATDFSESTEFLGQIGLKSYLYALLIPILLILFRKITTKFNIHFFRNKFILAIASVYLLFNTAPFKLFHSAYQASLEVKKEFDKLNSLLIDSEWGETRLNDQSKYDDYVLIIGESVRKDYLHAYGYPIENTPFMSKANGVLIDGLLSTGTYTIGSLKTMLTKGNKEEWKEDYSMTLIDLIKSSGIKTYWVSNQGYLGQFDTPISAIANKSDVKFFLKKGDSVMIDTKNTSDFELLPIFNRIVEESYNGKRFIVLHLYGSHPNACDRVKDFPKIFKDNQINKKYSYLNCYISSIKKTDVLLEKVFNHLKSNQTKNHRTFSMIYFADHGHCHSEKQGTIRFNQECTSKLHNNVPLFKISSDDTERNVYKVFKSGFNFSEGIANWIGISNKKIDPKFSLFSNENDPSDYGLQEKNINKRKVPIDPAIDIK